MREFYFKVVLPSVKYGLVLWGACRNSNLFDSIERLHCRASRIIFNLPRDIPSKEVLAQGSTLGKKPWGQLAPNFIDLVASTNFLVAKNFLALRAKDFYLKIYFNTVKLRLLLSLFAYHFNLPRFLQLEGKGNIKSA